MLLEHQKYQNDSRYKHQEDHDHKEFPPSWHIQLLNKVCLMRIVIKFVVSVIIWLPAAIYTYMYITVCTFILVDQG